jgi:ABC-type branched-subunit amino acid transport system permease subunit
MVKLIGLAALFAAGLVLAGGLAAGGVADITTLETIPLTTTISETVTGPTTVVTTVEQTTTQRLIIPTPATTWVWVVLPILACAVIGLLIALFTRRRGGGPSQAPQR